MAQSIQLNAIHSFYSISGALEFNLTNDYMFKGVLQESPDAYTLNSPSTSYVYTDKFKLSVVNLKHIDKATARDKQHKLDKWARFITATTWEELKELAKEDSNMHKAAVKLHELSSDYAIREEAIRRREYFSFVEMQERTISEQKNQLSKQANQLSKQEALIAKLQSEIDSLKNSSNK